MSKSLQRIELIIEKIKFIKNIIDESGGKIVRVLEDRQTKRPAILMHLTAIAEQMDKLKKEESSYLNFYKSRDLKGIYDIRTYIAHDYEGVNLAIIETAIRYGLEEILEISESIIKTKKDIKCV